MIFFPKTESLKRTAFKRNAKTIRKERVKLIKSINKAIRLSAKRGNNHWSFSINESQSRFWDMAVVIRWYRRYSNLNVSITEEMFTTNDGSKHLDKIYGSVKW